MWAPEIHIVNNKYHIYYSAKNQITGWHALGLAISENPLGPYTDYGKPILERNSEMGIIDVHWFKDPNTQKSYLLWKENNWPFWPSEIYIRRIDENGITFRPEWPAKSILKAKFFDEWYCVEAPWMIYR